ncbi:MAG: YjbD family protein [Deltaproteobacteria bacterium]|jgi:putative ATP-dependent endonuclease of OLD family|nr:YjbD family protein [Deltaproteobacteria bacterium]
MKLIDITIKNFRGIRHVCLLLDDITVLYGENNTGKSTILDAVRLVMTHSLVGHRDNIFTEYDFHLTDSNSTPQDADPISINLHFAEKFEDEWEESIIQQLDNIVQLDPETGIHHIWLSVRGFYSHELASFKSQYMFLNEQNEEIKYNNIQLYTLARFCPLFFLSALRDSSKEFGQRGQFWSDFLKSIQLPDEEREKLEENLRQVNTSVISANKGLKSVSEKITESCQMVLLDDSNPVVLEAVPTRIFDLVKNIHVFIRSHNGVKLPLHRHGGGEKEP